MARVALVTGGTRGIGAAIARGLQAAGHKVAANYGGNDEAAQAFSAETGIQVYKWDVGNYEECRSGIARVVADLGPVEILVNNAGITRDGPFHKMDPGQWQTVINTNLGSVFNMTRGVIESMRGRKYGRIVNISSMNGQRGQFGQSNYAATKAGIFGFTKTVAVECAAKGITVNAVAPGYVDTDMFAKVPQPVKESIVAQIPVGRLGSPDEVAPFVVMLASEEASFITGSTISVNGGQYVC